MLVPGIDYQPLKELDDPKHRTPEQRLAIFKTVYADRVRPQSTYGNYFRRWGHGRIFGTIFRIYEKKIMPQNEVKPEDFSAILESMYKKGVLITEQSYETFQRDYLKKRESEVEYGDWET
jgi:hypothetical protein